ncbi:MAG: transposase [Mycobacterium sp.]|nr:transposase [Mycobacterium sp.]
MRHQRTSVGLDVHARSVVGCGLVRETGEVRQRRLTPDYGEILDWISGLPAPVAVTYEAGPTGFGLARALLAAGIECVVAAPSKLQRPAGDRVKTDARDARHLARLLHLGEITAVTVPSVEQEAARDLVRAREDCRGDLMAARHRLSKLLLARGSSTTEGRRGRPGTRRGCGLTGSTPAGSSWPMTPPSTRCWPPWTAATASTRRSPKWPPIRYSPRW